MKNIITDLIDIINNGPDNEFSDYTRSNVKCILKAELKRMENTKFAIEEAIRKYDEENPTI